MNHEIQNHETKYNLSFMIPGTMQAPEPQENMQSTCVVNLPKVIIESRDNIIQILKIPEQTNANYSVC